MSEKPHPIGAALDALQSAYLDTAAFLEADIVQAMRSAIARMRAAQAAILRSVPPDAPPWYDEIGLLTGDEQEFAVAEAMEHLRDAADGDADRLPGALLRTLDRAIMTGALTLDYLNPDNPRNPMEPTAHTEPAPLRHASPEWYAAREARPADLLYLGRHEDAESAAAWCAEAAHPEWYDQADGPDVAVVLYVERGGELLMACRAVLTRTITFSAGLA